MSDWLQEIADHFPGVTHAAAGGTLSLNEIGDITLDSQPKLLRFLDSHEIHPVDEVRPVLTDVRVIAATNADFDVLVAEGRLREDLFYWLNIVRLHVPPLRESRVKIPVFANHYLRKHAQEHLKGDLRLVEKQRSTSCSTGGPGRCDNSRTKYAVWQRLLRQASSSCRST